MNCLTSLTLNRSTSELYQMFRKQSKSIIFTILAFVKSRRYTPSTVTLVDGKLSSFHQYLRYCYIFGTIVFTIANASYEPSLILLAQLSTLLAYLNMVFILEMALTEVQAISRINNIFKKANLCSNVRRGSYDGACYTEHSGNSFVSTVSLILME